MVHKQSSKFYPQEYYVYLKETGIFSLILLMRKCCQMQDHFKGEHCVNSDCFPDEFILNIVRALHTMPAKQIKRCL